MKWAIAGAGSIALARMVPALRRVAGAELVGVTRRDPEQRDVLSRALGPEVSVTPTLDDLLAEPGPRSRPDIVYVAAPPSAHESLTVSALRAGAHVLCEKPVGRTSSEVARMSEVAQEQGRLLDGALMMRHHSLHARIRAAIADGDLGELRSLRLRMAFDYAPDETEAGAWRLDPRVAGGGVVMDLGPHLIDLACHLTGARVDRVAAVGSRVRTREVEDTASVLLVLQGGVHVTLAMHFNIAEAWAPSVVEVCGTRGSATAIGTLGQVDGGTLVVRDADGLREMSGDPDRDLYVDQVRRFEALVERPSTWAACLEEQRRLQEVLDVALGQMDGEPALARRSLEVAP